jgi:hypothetical protein
MAPILLTYRSSRPHGISWSSTLYGEIFVKGCHKGPIHFLVAQFLCSTWQPFLRPDPHVDALARTGAVKAGRIFAATEGLALDGAEHAGTLGGSG